MTELVNTQAHRAARNAASITLADTGASSLRLYTAENGIRLTLASDGN